MRQEISLDNYSNIIDLDFVAEDVSADLVFIGETDLCNFTLYEISVDFDDMV